MMEKKIKFENSLRMFENGKRWIASGVSSQTRGPSWGFLPGIHPLFIEKAEGSRLYDVDGNEYIDYLLGFGPIILGHAYPKVIEAVEEQLQKGWLYGLSCELEQKVAEKIVKGVPCAQLVRFFNTGSEATMAATRIARAYNGKDKIVKFEGHYHGWHDWAMIDGTMRGTAISPITALTSSGIPESAVRDTMVLPWNDADALEKIMSRRGEEISAVVCEPTGAYPPEKGYLEEIRKITREHDVLLIFDEIKTGFRLAFGGAQKYFGVTPDLSTFSKGMANGFQVSAVAGDKEVMSPIIDNKIYLAGTFQGHPLSMAASLATLTEIENEDVPNQLFKLGSRLLGGIRNAIEDTDIDVVIQGPESMPSIYFTQLEKISSARDAQTLAQHPHNNRLSSFVLEMIRRGIFLPARPHPCFISASHTEKDIDSAIQAAYHSLKEAKNVR